MSASNESMEWHLTPRGWEEGTFKHDFGTIERETPKDRVATAFYQEKMSSAYSPIKESSGYVWQSDDKETVNSLREKFGPPPKSFYGSPPKSS